MSRDIKTYDSVGDVGEVFGQLLESGNKPVVGMMGQQQMGLNVAGGMGGGLAMMGGPMYPQTNMGVGHQTMMNNTMMGGQPQGNIGMMGGQPGMMQGNMAMMGVQPAMMQGTMGTMGGQHQMGSTMGGQAQMNTMMGGLQGQLPQMNMMMGGSQAYMPQNMMVGNSMGGTGTMGRQNKGQQGLQ